MVPPVPRGNFEARTGAVISGPPPGTSDDVEIATTARSGRSRHHEPTRTRYANHRLPSYVIILVVSQVFHTVAVEAFQTDTESLARQPRRFLSEALPRGRRVPSLPPPMTTTSGRKSPADDRSFRSRRCFPATSHSSWQRVSSRSFRAAEHRLAGPGAVSPVSGSLPYPCWSSSAYVHPDRPN